MAPTYYSIYYYFNEINSWKMNVFSREWLVFCEQQSDLLMKNSDSLLSLLCKEQQ